jgi:enamidase
VLLKAGRIERVWDGRPTKGEESDGEIIEAIGKTLLPGLMDVHVHLGAPGGSLDPQPGTNYNPESAMQRAAATYLFSGVVAIKSAGFHERCWRCRSLNRSPRGSGLFVCGPVFTVPQGHGTEYFRNAPEFLRQMGEREFTRLPRHRRRRASKSAS